MASYNEGTVLTNRYIAETGLREAAALARLPRLASALLFGACVGCGAASGAPPSSSEGAAEGPPPAPTEDAPPSSSEGAAEGSPPRPTEDAPPSSSEGAAEGSPPRPTEDAPPSPSEGAAEGSPPRPTEDAPPSPRSRPAPRSGSAESEALPFTIGGSAFVLESEGPRSRRYTSSSAPGCTARIDWWRPFPRETGGRMMIASRRQVSFAGTRGEVLTTSMFEGVEREVAVTTLRGPGWFARFVFDACRPSEVDAFLSAVTLDSSAP